MAALVDAAMFERIRRMQERFDALSDRLARAYEPVPEDAGMAEIARAGAKARREVADAWRAARRLPKRHGTGAPEALQAREPSASARAARTPKAGKTRSTGKR